MWGLGRVVTMLLRWWVWGVGFQLTLLRPASTKQVKPSAILIKDCLIVFNTDFNSLLFAVQGISKSWLLLKWVLCLKVHLILSCRLTRRDIHI